MAIENRKYKQLSIPMSVNQNGVTNKAAYTNTIERQWATSYMTPNKKTADKNRK